MEPYITDNVHLYSRISYCTEVSKLFEVFTLLALAEEAFCSNYKI